MADKGDFASLPHFIVCIPVKKEVMEWRNIVLLDELK